MTANHTLVLCFLRGGMDGLTAVASTTDPFYVAQRGTLAVPPPTSTPELSTALPSTAGDWAVPVGVNAILPMYTSGELAFIHGVLNPAPNPGSHFSSQDHMEDGVIAPPNGDGWGARVLNLSASNSPLLGIGIGTILQRTLVNGPRIAPVPDPANYGINGDDTTAGTRLVALGDLFATADQPLQSAAGTAIDGITQLASVSFNPPANNPYPAGSPFGARLQQVQQIIEANVGIETIMLDYGGWDDHSQLGPLPGGVNGENMHLRMKDFFESIAAFHGELANTSCNYTFVFMTEFGRRITTNTNAGVDHGEGSLMGVFANGGSASVRGGEVHTIKPSMTEVGWDGLSAHSVLHPNLGSTSNMLGTCDYRRVLGEVLEKRLGLGVSQIGSPLPGPNIVFPGYNYGVDPDKMPIGIIG